jgi:hypothetical protein
MPHRGQEARDEHKRVKEKAALKGRTKHLTVRVKPELFEKIVKLQYLIARNQQSNAPSLDTVMEVILHDLHPGVLAAGLQQAGEVVEHGHRLPRDVSASLRKVKG